MSDSQPKITVTWGDNLSNPYGTNPELKARIEAKIVSACETKAYNDHSGKTLVDLGAKSVEIRYVLPNDVYHAATQERDDLRSRVHKGGSDRNAENHICVWVRDAAGKPILTTSPLTKKKGKTHHIDIDMDALVDQATREAPATSTQPEAEHPENQDI
ncbi:uncharacterized protein TRAVEDRAFT_24190 [Trametes versicolor FP-101664 SS1]|uniref:uncharacterized protein n=1 Tax=Trametes versicolor (strain FP-101664) TaxID=717944 RepID=UPI0004623022|nr:uncharacterized protein TRAVEDRAFT_24190 [Trametes versicolor FP-101664 SS1]EIW52768.1 hypothetical protein TRAVEDRAFT_24190 [Trametes versicolor FP-101664 SS1]